MTKKRSGRLSNLVVPNHLWGHWGFENLKNARMLHQAKGRQPHNSANLLQRMPKDPCWGGGCRYELLGLDGILGQGSPPVFCLSQRVPKNPSWALSQEAGQMSRRQGLTLG